MFTTSNLTLLYVNRCRYDGPLYSINLSYNFHSKGNHIETHRKSLNTFQDPMGYNALHKIVAIQFVK